MDVLVLMPLAEQRGGGELMLLELLRNAGATGVNWRLVVFDDGPLVDDARALGIDTTVVHAGRLRQPARYARTVGTIRRLARDADVTLSWMTKAHLYGGPAAVLGRRPVLWFQLGMPRRWNVIDRLATLIPARGVITLSREADRAQRNMRPSRPTRLVYPSVDLARFDPESTVDRTEARESLGLHAARPIIGVVARLQKWKGLHLLIEALPGVQDSFPEAMVVVVGGSHFSEPNYERDLRRLAESLGLHDDIVFAGFQSDIPRWLSAMDVVAHPAFDEPFGISVIEAMAMGKPIVASDTGGPLEIIDHEKNGLLFRTGDPVSLAAEITLLLRHQLLARAIGESARARASEFSSSDFALNVRDAVIDLAWPARSYAR